MSNLSLLIVSKRAPNSTSIKKCVLPSTIVYEYDDTAALNDILVGIHRQLAERKVSGVALLLQSTQSALLLCGREERVVSESSTSEDQSVKSFFSHLVQSHLMPTRGRLDIFNTCLTDEASKSVSRNLSALLKVPVEVWGDDLGADHQVGKLYFDVEKLQSMKENPTAADQRLEGYEKIRTVGKGAFGTAILYRKLQTDTLVVIKEINMMELTANERQMALNEVQVLSVLNHPNIVSYYRSFERDGLLMIEMEYADGGTLAQRLARLTRPLPEREILDMFRQTTAAIRHMHQHNILHRDLKTANVFLTKENVIKVGDFGISKAMTTRAQAQTVLGTPYYISPEMCEGKQYDQKSDIWALGCILYEMACLKKPFQGSSLPALVNSIMKGSYQSLPAIYTVSFRHLISQILQREPHNRPTAGELLEVMIPRTLDLLARQETSSSIQAVKRNQKERSVLYEIQEFGPNFSLSPIPLPPRIKIAHVAVSSTHFIVLTSELTVFTWGEGGFGQLGHGDSPAWRSTPTAIAALGDHTIRSVAAGTGFSLFISDSGMLLTCGDNSHGCLGQSDSGNLLKPKLIEKLLQVDITAASCGPCHVVALASDGSLYAWGSGKDGRLGLGHERSVSTPTAVDVTVGTRTIISSVHCGADGTIVITSDGSPYATGNNSENKLGLNTNSFFFGRQVLEKSLTFQRVASVKEPIVDMSMGDTHTCLMTSRDTLITMGSNDDDQLGHNFVAPSKPNRLSNYALHLMTAGPTYTAVTTVENLVLAWGKMPANKTQPSAQRSNEIFYSVPTEILAMYASPSQLQAGNSLCIGGIHGSPRGLLLTIHTTAPLARISGDSQDASAVHHDGDTDSLGPVPEWLKSDIADSEAAWGGYTNTATSFT